MEKREKELTTRKSWMLHEYFQSHKGFARLFNLLKQKYISLNRFSGTVTLKDVTKEESIDLSNFFGKMVKEGTDFRTSFSKIEKKLKETKYANFTWEELFNNYFEEKIITKKDLKQKFNVEEDKFYQNVLSNTPVNLKEWFKNILKDKNIHQTFVKNYKQNKSKFYDELLYVLKIINITLKKEPISLVMLASYSLNPHFLDFGTKTSNLYFKLLSNLTNKEEPKTSGEKIKFLSLFNIYIDTISNYVTIYNIESDSPLINNFTKEKEPLNLSLSNLSKITKIDTKLKKVFVFENPSILPYLKKYDIPIVIGSGNPNYAFYKVIEKLVESKNEIYYNGDLDPEGLIIASNIYQNFPQTNFFGYNQADYQTSKSKNKISESRLKKLDNINIPNLQEIKELLKKEKYAAYEEKNIQNIEKFIKQNLGK